MTQKQTHPELLLAKDDEYYVYNECSVAMDHLLLLPVARDA